MPAAGVRIVHWDGQPSISQQQRVKVTMDKLRTPQARGVEGAGLVASFPTIRDTGVGYAP